MTYINQFGRKKIEACRGRRQSHILSLRVKLFYFYLRTIII